MGRMNRSGMYNTVLNSGKGKFINHSHRNKINSIMDSAALYKILVIQM